MRLRVAATTILVGTSICVGAKAADIGMDCARLDAKQAEELRARAKLVLRNASPGARSLLVACDPDRAWVVWDGPPLELLQVKSDGNLVEAVLDTIETRARDGAPPPKREAPAKPRKETPPTPGELPTFERTPKAPPDEKPVATGGAGVGPALEILNSAVGPAVGPRLDLGVGWGPIYIALSESVRFDTRHEGASTFFFDLAGGVGYGAPFVPKYTFGAVATSGVEWFNVGSHTESTGFSALGLRAALPLGTAMLTPGIDGRYRYSPQFIGDTVNVKAPHWSALIVLEVVLQVEPILKKHRAEDY